MVDKVQAPDSEDIAELKATLSKAIGFAVAVTECGAVLTVNDFGTVTNVSVSCNGYILTAKLELKVEDSAPF